MKWRALLFWLWQKLLNAAMVGAFERWTEFAQEAKEMRVLLTRIAAKLSKRVLSGAYNRWAGRSLKLST